MDFICLYNSIIIIIKDFTQVENAQNYHNINRSDIFPCTLAQARGANELGLNRRPSN